MVGGERYSLDSNGCRGELPRQAAGAAASLCMVKSPWH